MIQFTLLICPDFYSTIYFVWDSDSQPGCRGTRRCRKEVSGVPPHLELLPFYWCFFYKKCLKIAIFNQLGVLPNFLNTWRVPRTKKSWKYWSRRTEIFFSNLGKKLRSITYQLRFTFIQVFTRIQSSTNLVIVGLARRMSNGNLKSICIPWFKLTTKQAWQP